MDGMEMFVVGRNTYYERTIGVLKDLIQRKKRVCYVTLAQPYSYLRNIFSDNQVDLKSMIFIDCVTKRIQNPPKIERVIFMDMPFVLDEIFGEINRLIQEQAIDYVIFDPLVQPALGTNDIDAARFMQKVVIKARMHHVDVGFLFPYEELAARILEKMNANPANSTG